MAKLKLPKKVVDTRVEKVNNKAWVIHHKGVGWVEHSPAGVKARIQFLRS